MNKIDVFVYRNGKIIIVVIILLMGFFIEIKQRIELERIVKTARMTVGVVSDKSCLNHGRIGYNYLVSGRSYEVWESASTCGLINCGHIAIGEKINVTYSSANPELATCASLSSGR